MTDASDSQPTMDIAQTFQMEALDVRGRLVRLGPALDAILDAHGYPDVVAELLAETVVLAVTLASSVKYDGIFTLQVQGDGPVSMLVADVTSKGALRGYARFDANGLVDAVKQVADGAAPVPHFLGVGQLVFTVDQGKDMERYQGIAALEGATLSDCAHHYFRHSEQLDTAIYVTAQRVGTTLRAGAMMVQRMPHSTHARDLAVVDEDGWRRTVAILASLGAGELLDSNLTPETLIYRLYHEEKVRAYPAQVLFHACRCSREKVSATLKSFPRAEIMGDDGEAEVVCEFCKTSYQFSAHDLDALFKVE